jgi:hypothetical protein
MPTPNAPRSAAASPGGAVPRLVGIAPGGAGWVPPMTRHCLLSLSLLASPACASLSDVKPAGDAVPITFTNHSKHSVCELYAIPTQAKLWGKSRLAASVAPGQSATLMLHPGRHSVRAGECGVRNTLLVLHDLDVVGPHELVLHGPGAVEASNAGRTAWPVTTWLALAADWYVPQALLAAGPAHRVKLESACEQDLRLRLGPGEITTMPAESFARLALPDATSVAIVDSDGHEVAGWVSATGKQHVRIASSCQAIAAL